MSIQDHFPDSPNVPMANPPATVVCKWYDIVIAGDLMEQKGADFLFQRAGEHFTASVNALRATLSPYQNETLRWETFQLHHLDGSVELKCGVVQATTADAVLPQKTNATDGALPETV
jgi:hypothetical protein